MQNCHNSSGHRNSLSGFKGVGWNNSTSSWQARIEVNKKQYNLGYFVDKFDAAKAYDAAAYKFYGEYAKLNFSMDDLTPVYTVKEYETLKNERDAMQAKIDKAIEKCKNAPKICTIGNDADARLFQSGIATMADSILSILDRKDDSHVNGKTD